MESIKRKNPPRKFDGRRQAEELLRPPASPDQSTVTPAWTPDADAGAYTLGRFLAECFKFTAPAILDGLRDGIEEQKLSR